MSLTNEQKRAAFEWANTDPKLNGLFREMKYELFYQPLIRFGVAATTGIAVFFGWCALWWDTVVVAPDWWTSIFSFITAISVVFCMVGIMVPCNLTRLKLLLFAALILPIPLLVAPGSPLLP